MCPKRMMRSTLTMRPSTQTPFLSRVFSQIKKPLLTSLSAILVLSGTHSYAQSQKDDEPWYQVEIIIFERYAPQYPSSDSEQWPKNIVLQYPESPVHLLSQEEAFQLHDAPKTSDTQNDLTSSDSSHSRSLSQTRIEEKNATEEAAPTYKEEPFIRLDAKQRNLNTRAKQLNRSRNMRVLYHEAWRQPFIAKLSSDNILILGGDAFEDHFELEGTINLSVNRFLHISTNIWLTTFSANYGQDNEFHWPPLPPIPQDLPQEHTEYSALTNEFAQQPLNAVQPLDKERFKLNTSKDESIWGAVNTTQPFNNTGFGLKPSNNGLEKTNRSSYIVEEIILMQQSRKMRSKELHYIDHPRLGILLEITPYDINQEKTPNE